MYFVIDYRDPVCNRLCLALRFKVKLAILFHTVVYNYCKVYPKAERNKKDRRYSFTTMKKDDLS